MLCTYFKDLNLLAVSCFTFTEITELLLCSQGTLAACGSRKGNVYMVELSQNMAQSDKNDKGLLTAVSTML